MVCRIFVEKKPGLDNEARALLTDAKTLLGIESLEKVRLLNRYDAENISPKLFDYAVKTVFSEPQLDIATAEADTAGAAVFAVEYLPGQFDQRADSAAQCIQIISQGERPLIRSAKLYALYGNLTEQEISEIKKYVINPVEAREAALEKPETLKTEYVLSRGICARLRPCHGCRRYRFLPDLFYLRKAGSHHHRDPDAGHLLVRSLPTYYFPDGD